MKIDKALISPIIEGKKGVHRDELIDPPNDSFEAELCSALLNYNLLEFQDWSFFKFVQLNCR